MAKYETPDPTPIEVPSGFKVPETMQEMIQRLVKQEDFRKALEQEGAETFEEAEDFDIDDDMWDPQSPYEEVFDPTLGRGITHDEFIRNREVYEERYKRAFDQLHASDALRARVKPQAPDPAEQSGPKAAEDAPDQE